ncbi:MAG: hypothetical protein PVJ80_16105 [Gemmatimonadota bacterium]
MRLPVFTWLFLSAALPLSAQGTPPAHWAELELARTATCADVLSRLETLDTQLAPLAARAQRLLAIGGAIDIEESSIVDSLDTADPLEAAVRDWFVADQQLAQQYLAEESQAILDQRAAARKAIQDRVAQALDEMQAQADSVMEPTGTLQQDAVGCSGVLLIRSAAVEACGRLQSRVCQAARDSTVDSPFRFVPSAEDLWYREELRPWTAPGPMRVTPQGQLSGARTVGDTRIGNVVISVALNPMLQARENLTAEEAAVLDSINAPLGIRNTHPNVAFVPALAIQAALPHALGDETGYVVHFGAPEDADVVWAAPADTGDPIVGNVALAPEHVARLARGEALTLTAVRAEEDGENQGVFSVQLTAVNQASRVQSLLAYMAQQLSSDLERLMPPGTSDAPVDSAAPATDPGLN